jgi:hypothetical protein
MKEMLRFPISGPLCVHLQVFPHLWSSLCALAGTHSYLIPNLLKYLPYRSFLFVPAIKIQADYSIIFISEI